MSEHATIGERIVSAVIWIVAGSFLILSTLVLMLLYRFFRPDRLQVLERWYCRTQLALTFNRRKHRN